MSGFVGASSAFGAAATYEPFDYLPATPLPGQTPTGYVDEWTVPGNFVGGHTVSVSGLSYPGLSTSGNAVDLPQVVAADRLDFVETYYDYDSGTGSSTPTAPNGVFFSFLMRVTMTPGTDTTANFFGGMNYYTDATTAATPNGWGGMLFVRRGTSTDPNSTYEVGLAKNNRAPATVTINGVGQSVPAHQIGWDPTARNSGDTILVVGQYEFNTRASITDDTANLWVNPVLDGSLVPTPTATTSVGSDVYTASGTPTTTIFNLLNSFIFRSTSGVGWPGAITVDELRVGTSYADVVVPEPASLGLLAVAGATAALARRRRRH